MTKYDQAGRIAGGLRGRHVRLLMDYVAESEGKKALEENRALQEDPDAEVPQEVRRACLKEIRRAFRKSPPGR